jgi:hypothetical protein
VLKGILIPEIKTSPPYEPIRPKSWVHNLCSIHPRPKRKRLEGTSRNEKKEKKIHAAHSTPYKEDYLESEIPKKKPYFRHKKNAPKISWSLLGFWIPSSALGESLELTRVRFKTRVASKAPSNALDTGGKHFPSFNSFGSTKIQKQKRVCEFQ